VIPLIETASSLTCINSIAAAPRVHQLMIGELDLGLDLGIAHRSAVWSAIRVQLVIASMAAGLHGPIGPIDVDFRNLDRLRNETRDLYEMGYRSRAAIHPAQIPVYREALLPSEEEITRARHVVELYAAALAKGRGSVAGADGRMIDEAAAKWAQQVLSTMDDHISSNDR